MYISGISDIGAMRKLNQDNYYTKMITDKIALGVVCDGMGGANGGCEASAIAIFEFSDFMREALRHYIDESGEFTPSMSDARMRRLMTQGVNRANDAVYNKAKENTALSGMGTTLVCTVSTPERVYCMNVGDSRMYTVNNEDITQITKDHSYVQYLVDSGAISAEEAEHHPQKNIITRAIGTHDSVEGEFFVLESANVGRFIMLCSDGLTNFVKESHIHEILISDGSDEEKIQKLVDAANSGGGGDNITVVVTSFN